MTRLNLLQKLLLKIKQKLSLSQLKRQYYLTEKGDLSIASLPQPKQIFFIVGHPKSGTTWMSLLLNNHPEITCKFEGHFFERTDEYNNLTKALQESELLQSWFERKFNKWVYNKDQEILIFVKLITNFYLQREIFLNNKYIVGDKSPSYNLKKIYNIFPKAKIIHVIRDGRDVAISMAYHRSEETERYMTFEMAKELDLAIENSKLINQNLNLPLNYLKKIAKTWSEEVSIGRMEGQKYFKSQYLEIKYEDLQFSSEKTLMKVLQFLEANDSEKTIKECLEKASFAKLSGGRKIGQEDPKSFFRKGIVGDWKNILTKEQLEVFYTITEDILLEFNYLEKNQN